MTPAFSPGPQITRGPVVGNVLSQIFDDLYEQFSLHITEKMPSPVELGARLRIATTRSNSSLVSPCSAARPGVTLLPPFTAARSPARRRTLSRQCRRATDRWRSRDAASARAQ